jgi:hypothetical protein
LLESYPNKRNHYNDTAQLWQESLSRLKKQKMFQYELDDRKKRLEEERARRLKELKDAFDIAKKKEMDGDEATERMRLELLEEKSIRSKLG